MKYLMDSLASYEENYSDALNPHRTDRADFFMGDEAPAAPVSNQMFGDWTRNLTEVIKTAMIVTAQTPFHPPSAIYYHSGQIPVAVPPAPAINPKLNHMVIWNLQLCRSECNPYGHPAHLPSALLPPNYPPPPTTFTPSFGTLPAIYQQSSYPLGYHLQITRLPTMMPVPDTLSMDALSIIDTSRPTNYVFSSMAAAAPKADIGNAIIPNLPKKRGGDSWRIALHQWHEVDLRTGFALKNWPSHWYTGVALTKNASKRQQRELIAIAHAR